jgi:hypothetical protein
MVKVQPLSEIQAGMGRSNNLLLDTPEIKHYRFPVIFILSLPAILYSWDIDYCSIFYELPL